MNKVKEFLEAMQKDPKAREMAKSIDTPQNVEDIAAGYVQVAEAMGYSFTKDELVTGLVSLVKEQQEKTAKAEENVKQALDDSALEMVAGGTPGDGTGDGCDETYVPGEWCWFNDSCDIIINGYDPPLKNYQMYTDTLNEAVDYETYQRCGDKVLSDLNRARYNKLLLDIEDMKKQQEQGF